MNRTALATKGKPIIPEVVEPTLSRRHEAVIVALLTNPTIKDAAVEANVSESTVWRLMQRDDFQQRYKDAQAVALNGALGSLQGVATLAVDALRDSLSSVIPQVKVQAAKVILDFTLKTREQFGLEERIKELERRLRDRSEGA